MTEQQQTTLVAEAPISTGTVAATEEVVVTPTVPEVTSTEPVTEGKWFDVLSDELKTNKNITKFNTLDDFANWQANASKLIGKKVQELSSEEIRQFLTPEELLEAVNSRGVPTTPEEYEIPSLDSRIAPELALAFKQKAIEAGITPDQTEAMIQYNNQAQEAMLVQQKEDWTNQLLETYGKGAGEEMHLARTAAEKYCSPELMAELETAGLGHHPEVIKAFAKIAREMLPDHIPRGGTTSTTSKAQAQAEIDKLIRDPDFYSRWKRQERGAVEELNAVYAKLEQ